MKPYANAFVGQIALMRGKLDGGTPRLGWKIGINVPEIQRKLELVHALVGWLDGDRRFASGSFRTSSSTLRSRAGLRRRRWDGPKAEGTAAVA